MKPGPDGREWFALHTRARHERKVARGLEERSVEAYVPLVTRESRWHDRTKQVEWPLFPGYLFARLAPTEFTTALRIPGVASIVSSAGRPAPITADEIENVRKFVAAIAVTGSPVEVQRMLERGEEVNVRAGPFAGVRGRVIEARSGKVILQVGMNSIGQAVRLELSRELVGEPTGAGGR